VFDETFRFALEMAAIPKNLPDERTGAYGETIKEGAASRA
jgi:hypothetical protein